MLDIFVVSYLPGLDLICSVKSILKLSIAFLSI